MILNYDRRPDATIDEKLQSLIDQIHLALNEKVDLGGDYIRAEEYDLGEISYSAGTIGTVASVIETGIAKKGFVPVSVTIRYVYASPVGLSAVMSADKKTLYTHVVRRQSTAFSAPFRAYAIVLYMKG